MKRKITGLKRFSGINNGGKAKGLPRPSTAKKPPRYAPNAINNTNY